jgi:hypothetical protein
MAVSGIKGTGIGQVTLPEFGGPMALQAGLRAAEPEYVEDITGGVQDYTGGLTGAGLGLIDILGDFLGKSTDERLRAGTSTQPITTDSFQAGSTTREQVDPSQEPIIYQDEIMRIAESLKKTMPEKTTGSFQAGDTTRDQVDPTQSGQRNIGLSDDEEASMAGADAGASEETIKDVTITALQDYLDQARPGTQPKDYAEYIKEFSDATGLDVSGKPDKSTALMALGLSLMQNKAGKGFDVGKMLGAVGEAGEKALPEYQKAKSEARALRAKAGEYALGRRKEDEVKAQQRQFIYVVPKEGQGKTEADRLRNRMMQGSYIRVNASELNALDTNEAFNRKYEFLPGDALANMKDLFKAPESSYMDKPMSMDFLGGDLKVQVRMPKAGKENLPARYASADQSATVEDALNSKRFEIDSMDERFTEFVDAFNRTKPTTVSKVASSLYGGLRGLGFIGVEDFGTAQELETDVQGQQRFLTYVQSRYAPQILQEAGKTISDADRQRVEAIVGDIKTLSLQDPAQLAAKVQQLHELVILGQRRELAKDFAKHNRMGGSAPIQPLTKEQQARYEALKRKYDAEYGFTSSTNDDGKEVLEKSDEEN